MKRHRPASSVAPGRVAAIAATLALHLAVVNWLLSGPGTQDVPRSSQPLQVVYWLERPRSAGAKPRSPDVEAVQEQPRRHTQTTERQPHREAASAPKEPALEAVIVDSPAPKVIDLSLREKIALESSEERSRLPWERSAPPPPPPTRFDRAWAPTGKSVQHGLAFRSALASHLLGAVGALKEPCTKQERDRMEEKCHGAQYRGDFGDRVERLNVD